MARRILFVDDDRYISELYITALCENGFTVELCDNADDADVKLTAGVLGYDAIVLDLSMIPGKASKDEAALGGLGTGVWLYKRLRKVHPTVPVVVLTNVLQGPILEQLPTSDDPQLVVVHKIDTDPFDLHQSIDDLLPPVPESLRSNPHGDRHGDDQG
jgi:CheY-like chemotaxis protein